MKKSISLMALTGILTLASCGQNGTTPVSCTAPQVEQNGVCVTPTTPVTTGSVNFVKGTSVVATVKDSTGKVVDAAQYGTLAPGKYTVVFSQNGYASSEPIEFTITAGNVTTVTAPALVKNVTPTTPTTRGYYYVRDGNLVAIPSADLTDPNKFVFTAWLEDEASGLTVTNNTTVAGTSTAAERTEVAPSRVQNLASAYVAYRAADGKTYPVAGATVRWNITGAAGPFNPATGLPTTAGSGQPTNVIFGAADDGGNDTNFMGGITPAAISVSGKQADTVTNSANAAGRNTPFPSTSTEYPLYYNSVNGLNNISPNMDGYTWTTLFSTADRASAEVVAIAFVGDMEIGKQVLNKYFAPRPNVTIKKSVLTDSTAPATDGQTAVGGTVTMRIAVTNTGAGTATNVNVTDRLVSGAAAPYSVTAPTVTPAGAATTTLQGNDGFDTVIPTLAPGQTVYLDFPVSSTETGVYCDQATLANYSSTDFGIVNAGLTSNACAVFVAPNVNVFKNFVDANGVDLGTTRTVPANTPARLRIRLVNNGGAAANVTDLIDNLVRVNGTAVTTADANYSITLPTTPASTANARDGFSVNSDFTLQPGEQRDIFFTAQASADGRYCDQVSVISNGGNPVSNEACLIVATPRLAITKTNNVNSVKPGGNYTSTIVVRNTGNGTAEGVKITDIIGTNGTAYVNYVSSSYAPSNGTATSGFYNPTNRTVYAGADANATLNIPVGGSVTLTVVSSVPASALPGSYCDFASFTSTNAGTGNASACVRVNSFVSVATQITDNPKAEILNDGTDSTILYSVLAVETSSNQGVNNNVLRYNFGDVTPQALNSGQFDVTATELYIAEQPTRDPLTNVITSDYTTARRLVLGTDYTLAPGATSATGTQTVTLSPSLVVPIGGVIFARHTVVAPGIAAGEYNSGVVWTYTGAQDGTAGGTSTVESTTVVTP